MEFEQFAYRFLFAGAEIALKGLCATFITFIHGYAGWLLAWKIWCHFTKYMLLWWLPVTHLLFRYHCSHLVSLVLKMWLKKLPQLPHLLPRQCTAKIIWCAKTACLFAVWFNNSLSASRPLNCSVTLTNEVGKMWKEVAEVFFEVLSHHWFGWP